MNFHGHVNVVNIGPIDVLRHEVEELEWHWWHIYFGSATIYFRHGLMFLILYWLWPKTVPHEMT